MYFSGNGLTVRVYDHTGAPKETRTLSWSEVGVTGEDSTSYTYHFPADDGNYYYEFEYTTDVETTSATDDVRVSNDAEYEYGKTTGTGVIGVDDKSDVKKSVVSFDSREATWKVVLHVPEKGLSKAEVIDYLSSTSLKDFGWRMAIDMFQNSSLEVTGLLEGETHGEPQYIEDLTTPGKSRVRALLFWCGRTRFGVSITDFHCGLRGIRNDALKRC